MIELFDVDSKVSHAAAGRDLMWSMAALERAPSVMCFAPLAQSCIFLHASGPNYGPVSFPRDSTHQLLVFLPLTDASMLEVLMTGRNNTAAPTLICTAGVLGLRGPVKEILNARLPP